MFGVEVKFDKNKLQEIRNTFTKWPGATARIVKESINATVDKTNTKVISALHEQNPSIKKKVIRKGVKKVRATFRSWIGRIIVRGSGLPLIKFAKKGRKSRVVQHTTVRQSIWLFYNVFKAKYGDAAIFATSYKIVRKAYQRITTRINGKTKSLAGTGAFIATMRSGHTGIFKRKMWRGIKEMRGPGLGKLLSTGRALRKIEKNAGKELHDDIDRRIARYLEMMKERAA